MLDFPGLFHIYFGAESLDSVIDTSTTNQENKFQTNHSNLDTTNVYPQLDTSTRPMKLRTINPIVNITC